MRLKTPGVTECRRTPPPEVGVFAPHPCLAWARVCPEGRYPRESQERLCQTNGDLSRRADLG